MDPITLVVTALAAGAAAGLKPTAEKVVRDAYEGLRTVVRDRYTRARESVESLEARPDSEARKAVVMEDLADAEAGADEALLQQAQRVLDAVQRHAPEAAEAAAVDLEDIRVGASLNISDVVAAGAAVRVRGADVARDVNIRGIRTGRSDDPPGS